jgi:hypothetical protein
MYIRLLQFFLLAVILSACIETLRPSVEVMATTMPDPAGIRPAQPSIVPPTIGSTKSIGTPVPGWEDIPIMPGAYDPELTEMVYLYTVDTPVDQVEEFYTAKMDVNGWTLTNRQTMNAGPAGGPSTVLDFQKNERLLNVMLVNLVEKNATSVILSQLGP